MPARGPASEFRRGRNRLAAIIVIGHAVKHIYTSGLQALLLPEIKIGMGLGGAQFGALLSARQVVAWGTTMFSGYLGDRFANRAPLILGLSLGLMGVGFYLAGHAPDYWTVLAAMMLAGLGPSMYHPSAIGELVRRFPDRHAFAISLHGTGGISGEVLGPLAVAGLLTWLTYRGVLQISLLPALIAGLLIWAIMRSLPRNEVQGTAAREYFSSLIELLKNPVLIFLVALTALRSMSDSAVAGFLPVFLREDLNFSELKVALYISLAHVAGLAAQPAMGYTSDRLGHKLVLVPGMAAVAILSLALAYVDKGALLAAIVIAKGAFTFSLHHIFIAAAIHTSRGHLQSTVVALIYGSGFLGIFSPYLAGLIVDKYSTQSAFLYAGSIALLATVALTALKLPRTTAQIRADPER